MKCEITVSFHPKLLIFKDNQPDTHVSDCPNAGFALQGGAKTAPSVFFEVSGNPARRGPLDGPPARGPWVDLAYGKKPKPTESGKSVNP